MSETTPELRTIKRIHPQSLYDLAEAALILEQVCPEPVSVISCCKSQIHLTISGSHLRTTILGDPIEWIRSRVMLIRKALVFSPDLQAYVTCPECGDVLIGAQEYLRQVLGELEWTCPVCLAKAQENLWYPNRDKARGIK